MLRIFKVFGPGPDQKVVSFSGITSDAGHPKTFAPSRPLPMGKAVPKFLRIIGGWGRINQLQCVPCAWLLSGGGNP